MTYPRYYFNVIGSADRPPELVIYRQASADSKLLPTCEAIPIKGYQVGKLIRDLAEHLR